MKFIYLQMRLRWMTHMRGEDSAVCGSTYCACTLYVYRLFSAQAWVETRLGVPSNDTSRPTRQIFKSTPTRRAARTRERNLRLDAPMNGQPQCRAMGPRPPTPAFLNAFTQCETTLNALIRSLKGETKSRNSLVETSTENASFSKPLAILIAKLRENLTHMYVYHICFICVVPHKTTWSA